MIPGENSEKQFCGIIIIILVKPTDSANAIKADIKYVYFSL